MIDMGLVFVDALAFLTAVWVFQLVRRERLYVGYGVIFVVVIVMGGVTLTWPAVLGPLNALSDLSRRSGVLVGLALAFVLLMLIYILSQLTLLSNRVTRLTQEIAIRGAMSDLRSDGRDRRTRIDGPEGP
jgi:hypothetical protein